MKDYTLTPFQEIKDQFLIPGKLYAMDFEIDNYDDLSKLKNKDHFTREEQNSMEGALHKALIEKGHTVQFSEFILKTVHEDLTFSPAFDVTGSFDLGMQSIIKPALPKKTIRVYFRVQSLTVIAIVGILSAIIFTTMVILVEPRFVRMMEAVNEPFVTAKDLAVGIVQEPRKIMEVGILGFIPVIALMAGVGYFILRKKAV